MRFPLLVLVVFLACCGVASAGPGLILGVADDDQVAEFKSAFVNAPWVDSRLVPNAGHCIDFHLAGRAFQLEQLAFALEAVLQARRPAPAEDDGVPAAAGVPA